MPRCDPCPDPTKICWCSWHPRFFKLQRNEIIDQAIVMQINEIKKQVADQFGIAPALLASRNQKARVAKARHLAIKRCRMETSATLIEIGREFNKTHASVIYALNH